MLYKIHKIFILTLFAYCITNAQDNSCFPDSNYVYIAFNLNTSTSNFPPQTNDDYFISEFSVVGDFNGWELDSWELTNVGGENYRAVSPVPMSPEVYTYNYTISYPSGYSIIESYPPRILDLTNQSGYLELNTDYWESESWFVEETEDIDVLFRVNTDCLPGYQGEPMYLVGSFTNWGQQPIELEPQFGNEDIWMGTVQFSEPTSIEYKFWWGWEGWESISNRTAIIHSDTTLSLVYWDDLGCGCICPDEVEVQFTVDMTAWIDEGTTQTIPLFSPLRDDELLVYVIPNLFQYNEPLGYELYPIEGTNLYTTTVAMWVINDFVERYYYKIDFSDESILYFENTFEEFDPEIGMEVFPQSGGIHRGIYHSGSSLNEQSIDYFSNTTINDVFLVNESIEVTFSIDMSTADNFDWGNQLYLRLHDKWFININGYPNEGVFLVDEGNDNCYSVTIPITGPVSNYLVYSWEFDSSDGERIVELNGEADHSYRVRYFGNSQDEVLTDITLRHDQWCVVPPLLIEPENLLGNCPLNGDVNADSQTNVLDVIEAVCFILGECILSDAQLCRIDYDGDDELNILDVVWLVDYILSE